jgi:hypothetical protein
MGLDKSDVASYGDGMAGVEAFLDSNPTSFGDPAANFDVNVIQDDENGETMVLNVGTKYKNCSSTNPTMATVLDTVTLEPIAPSANWGFVDWAAGDGVNPLNRHSGWFRVNHYRDLQDGDFTFSPIFVW